MKMREATMTSKSGFIFAPVCTIIRYPEGDVDINRYVDVEFWNRFKNLVSEGKVIQVHGKPRRKK